MAFCNKCGQQIDDNVQTCPNCGAPNGVAGNAQNFVNNFTNTADSTAQFDPQDIQNNKVMALLAYLGFLFLIPLLAAPNSRFARFHANQGLVLFIFEAIAGVVTGIICIIPFVGWIIGGILSAAVSIFGLVLMILGIVNAVNGQAKQLPLIGGITILK